MTVYAGKNTRISRLNLSSCPTSIIFLLWQPTFDLVAIALLRVALFYYTTNHRFYKAGYVVSSYAQLCSQGLRNKGFTIVKKLAGVMIMSFRLFQNTFEIYRLVHNP